MYRTRSLLAGALLVALAALAGPTDAQAYWRGGGGGWNGGGWNGGGWNGGGWHGGGWRGGGWGGGCCWGGGAFIGIAPVPLFPPPVFVPPPVIVAPPTIVVTPPPAIQGQSQASSGPPPFGSACYAAQWVCPLTRPTPVGNSCSCPVGGGLAWGRAN
jgi:hypothetical protein